MPGFSQLATARSLDGLINVFGIAKDTGIVWWIKQNPETPTPPKPWGTWQQTPADAAAGDDGGKQR